MAYACALGGLLFGASSPAWGRNFDLDAAAAGHQCHHVDMQADDALCTAATCALVGHARLACDGLSLAADRIDVALGPNAQFAGAQAQGDVVLVDGLRVLRCHAITLDGDRIRGTVHAATLAVRRPVPVPVHDAHGVPQGRDAFVLHGTLQRQSPQQLHLDGADFTLCDCGPNCLPSWRFDAPRIDLELGHRATIWWPRLRINVAGWLMPVTPPLLPLSVPLQDRAPGFLPPQLAFLRLPYPTIDLPFFIPLGPSWDLTVAPGIRTDWQAPRFGMRLRYRPSAATSGRMRLSYTHDGQARMAANVYAQDVRLNPDLATDAAYLAADAERRRLTERLSIDVEHRTRLARGPSRLDLLLDAVWVSDDLYNRDFLINPEQRVAAYLPSRAAATWRHPAAYATLAADAMLRLDSRKGGAVGPAYSNTRGGEIRTLHRAPAVVVGLLPLRLGAHFSLDGSASAVRYGNWSGATAASPNDFAQNIVGLDGGISFNRPIGPLALAARVGFDALGVQPDLGATFFDVAPLTAADLSLPLMRRFGQTLHVVRPKLAYRGLNRTYPAQGPVAHAAEDALDVRLLRRYSQQALLTVQQGLYDIAGAAAGTPWLSLDLGQPVDLQTGDLLQPFAALHWDSLEAGHGAVRLSLDPRRLHGEPLRELTAQYDRALGPVHLFAEYSRMAPDADRFQRSVYELAAPRGRLDPQSAGIWAHVLRGSLQAKLGQTLQAVYTAAYQLPQPEATAIAAQQVCMRRNGTSAGTHCFVSHMVRLQYQSPCDCWGIESILSGSPQDLRNTLRVQVMLTVAGTRVGNQNGGLGL